MKDLLSINFSTGLAAVLLATAAIILIVMIFEAICMAKPRKAKDNSAKASPAEASAEQVPTVEPPAAVTEEEVEELPTVAEVIPEPESIKEAAVEQVEESRPEKPHIQIPVAGKGEKVVYDKSFTARLILSDGDTKSYYSSLKNGLLKSGFESRLCWRHESFRADKKLAAKLSMRSEGLCLFAALEPDGYINSGGTVQDFSGKKTYKTTPLVCAVKGGKELQISQGITADLAQKFQTENAESEECDFAAALPYEELQDLIKKGLVKVKIYAKKSRVKKAKTPTEKPEEITLKITPEPSQKIPKKTIEKTAEKKVKKGVRKTVNLDVIFASFNDGEVASLEEIKNRIFGNKKNISYIKILGRGKADKNLTVIANAFSRAAQKNILDAGGKVIIKKA